MRKKLLWDALHHLIVHVTSFIFISIQMKKDAIITELLNMLYNIYFSAHNFMVSYHLLNINMSNNN